MTRLLTTEEVAERLRTTPAALYAAAYRGEGPPCVRVGRRRLYPEDLLDEWLRRRLDEQRSAQ